MKKILLFTSILILAGVALFASADTAEAALSAAQINQIEQILGKNSVHQSKIDKLRADAGISKTTIADTPSGATGVPFTGGSSCPLVVGSDGLARHDCSVDLNVPSAGADQILNRPVFKRTVLWPRDRNDDVQLLQEKLQDLGYFSHPDGATGFFGNATIAAVKQFQRANGLTDDAVVGPKTFAKLHDKLGTSGSTSKTTIADTPSGATGVPFTGETLCPLKFDPTTGVAKHSCETGTTDKPAVYIFANGLLRRGDSSSDTQQLQMHLKELGYLDTVSGVFDAATDTAVKRFQRSQSVTADGIVGQITAKEVYDEVLKKRNPEIFDGPTICPLVLDSVTGLAFHKCPTDTDPIIDPKPMPAPVPETCTAYIDPATGEVKDTCACVHGDLDITNPITGQNVKAGGEVKVTWRSCDNRNISIAGVNISLMSEDGSETFFIKRTSDDGHEIIEVPARAANKRLKLTLTLLGPTDGPIGSDSVIIFAKGESDGGVCETSDISQKISSPEAGSVYRSGSSLPIKWRSCPLTGNTVSINVISDTMAGQSLYSMRTENDGVHEIITPQVDRTHKAHISMIVWASDGTNREIARTTSETFVIEPASTGSQSITITQPTVGSVYTAGGVLPVTWRSVGIGSTETVLIKLVGRNRPQTGGTLISDLTAITTNDGSHQIELPTTLPEDTYSLAISYGLPSGDQIADWSGDFKIVAPGNDTPTGTPSIKVTQPGQNSSYVAGKSLPVSWITENIGANEQMLVDLVQVATTNNPAASFSINALTIAPSDTTKTSPNDGQETLVLPSSLPGGLYTVRVSLLGPANIKASGESALFNIAGGVAPGPFVF